MLLWKKCEGKSKIHTSETKTSTSVASSLPLVWCSAREKIDRFGRYGEMVASARTIAADSTAVKRASNLQACNPHETHSAQGHGPNVSRHFIATGLVQDAGKDGRVWQVWRYRSICQHNGCRQQSTHKGHQPAAIACLLRTSEPLEHWNDRKQWSHNPSADQYPRVKMCDAIYHPSSTCLAVVFSGGF